jgi:glycosyltransferase involved in cell wall biosynthesis
LNEIFRFFGAISIISHHRIDVVMGIYMTYHGIAAYLISKLFRKRLILQLIGDDVHKTSTSHMLKIIVKSANAVITRGENTRKRVGSFGVTLDKIHCPQNVFDFDRVPIIEADKVYDLIYVGNTGSYKRMDLLIDVVHKLKIKCGLESVKLVHVGEGPELDYYKAMTNDLDLIENIEFAGWCDNIYDYLYRSKVFIMTSEAEGLPMAMIEAMACGLPCVVPDDSDISTVAVDGVNSFVVPVGNVDLFAEKSYELLADDALYERMSKKAFSIRNDKREEYSIEYISEVWKSVFKELKVIR